MSEIAFIETPIKPVKSGGKGKSMPNKTNISEAPKASRKYQKSRGEHAKDILIAVLITAVVAFVAGMHFANKQNAAIKSAVAEAQHAVVPTAEAKTSK